MNQVSWNVGYDTPNLDTINMLHSLVYMGCIDFTAVELKLCNRSNYWWNWKICTDSNEDVQEIFFLNGYKFKP